MATTASTVPKFGSNQPKLQTVDNLTLPKQLAAQILQLINNGQVDIAWHKIVDLYNASVTATSQPSIAYGSVEAYDWLISPQTPKNFDWLITCQVLGLKACQKSNSVRFSSSALISYLSRLSGTNCGYPSSKLNLIGKLAFSLSRLCSGADSLKIKLASLALVNDQDESRVYTATVSAINASNVVSDLTHWIKHFPALSRFSDICSQSTSDWKVTLTSIADGAELPPEAVEGLQGLDSDDDLFSLCKKLISSDKLHTIAKILKLALQRHHKFLISLTESVVRHVKKLKGLNQAYLSSVQELYHNLATDLEDHDCQIILLSNSLFNLGILARTAVSYDAALDSWVNSIDLEHRLSQLSNAYHVKCERCVSLAIANKSYEIAWKVGTQYLLRADVVVTSLDLPTDIIPLLNSLCSLVLDGKIGLEQLADERLCCILLVAIAVLYPKGKLGDRPTKGPMASNLLDHVSDTKIKPLCHYAYFYSTGTLHHTFTDSLLLCEDNVIRGGLYFAKGVTQSQDVRDQLQMLTVAVNSLNSGGAVMANASLISAMSGFLSMTGHHTLRISLLTPLAQSNSDAKMRIHSTLAVIQSFLALENREKARHYLALAHKLILESNCSDHQDMLEDIKLADCEVRNVCPSVSMVEANSNKSLSISLRKLRLHCKVVFHDQSRARGVVQLQDLHKRITKTPDAWLRSELFMDYHFALTQIYEELGVVNSALFHLKAAIAIAESSQAHMRLMEFLIFLVEISLRFGNDETNSVAESLKLCEDLAQKSQCSDIRRLRLLRVQALYAQACGNAAQEEMTYSNLSDFLDTKLASERANESMGRLSLDSENKTLTSPHPVSNGHQCEVSCTESIYAQTILNRVSGLVHKDQLGKAQDLLETLLVTSPSCQSLPLFAIVKAFLLLKRAQKTLSLNPTYSSMEDSALSLPSVVHSQGRPGPLVKPTSTPIRTLPKKAFSLAYENVRQAIEDLYQAHDLLNASAMSKSGPNSDRDFAKLANLFNSVCMVLCGIANVDEPSNVSVLELSKGLSFASERAIYSARLSSGSNSLPTPALTLNASSSNIDCLPPQWVVLSINASSDGILSVTRFDQQRGSFTLSLPLNRHNALDADEPAFTLAQGLTSLREIISASNESATYQTTSSIKTAAQRKAWWDNRFKLDSRLKKLVADMEFIWFGGFRGLFSDKRIEIDLADEFATRVKAIFADHIPAKKLGRLAKHTPSTQQSILFELNMWVFDLFLTVGHPGSRQPCEPALLEDLIYFVLDIMQFHGEEIPYDEIDMDRLVLAIENAICDYHVKLQEYEQESYEHIVLVLDKSCHELPWESMPMLRSKSVSRVPSLDILQTLLNKRQKHLTLSKELPVKYILNPGGDLVKTQSRFELRFQSQQNWSGLMGQEPSESQLVDTLSSDCIAIYIGHGGAEQYIRASQIKKSSHCAPTLLLGCSSGKVHRAGEYQSYGTPLVFCTASCPMLVAMLWDVTDKDIDQFSMSLLEKWGLLEESQPGLSICSAVSRSRDVCTLRYLNGGAPIVYGLPLRLK